MKTVLIVDDVPVSRTVIEVNLKGLDVEVIGEAANGKEAVEKYVELDPDIVIMDIAMHEMNGIDALKAIMQYDPDAAVVIISSIGDQRFQIYEAMDAGAKAVLKKPIEKDKFIAEITKLL